MKDDETIKIKNSSYSFKDSCNVFFFAVLAFFVVSLVFSFVISRIAAHIGKTTSELLSLPFVVLLSSLLSEGAFFVVFIVYSKAVKKKVLASSTLNQKIQLSKLFLIAIFSVCVLLCSINFTSMMNYVFSLFASPSSSGVIFTENFWQFLLSVFSLCLLPAICEELVFRGIVLNGFLSKLKPSLAILLSAGLFALIHMSIYSTVHQFIIGILLGMIFYMTGKIVYCMAFHFVNNFAVVLITYIFGNNFPLQFSSWGAREVIVTILVLLLGVAISVLFYFYLKKKGDKKKQPFVQQQDAKVNDKYSKVTLCLSAIFCFVFWLINSFGG